MLSGKQREFMEKQLAKPLPDDEKGMYTVGRKFVLKCIEIYMNIFFPMRYEGLENIPQNGPALLCGNHTAFLDIPLVSIGLINNGRWIYWVARESLMKSRFLAWLMPWFGVTPVDTSLAETSTIKTIFANIRKNRIVGIFPQGTRCKTREKLMNTPPKIGAVSFALRTKTPIIPVAIAKEFKPFRKSKLIIGEPYYIESDRKRLSDEELMAHSIELMDRIFALKGEKYPLKNRSLLTGGILQDIDVYE